jgi:hypothetical protein
VIAVLGRTVVGRAALLSLASLLIGCGGGVIQRAGALPVAPPGQGFIQIACEPPTVMVYIDGHFHGQLDGYPSGVMRVTAGPHRIGLRKAGFYPWYGRVEAGPEAARLSARLVPEVRLEP